ncbi:site-2 protease family protein [Laceyella putida]|uniref:Site-2 protease family protein n=1 Tax=Laceyella putida TaxID=110101 RepID=A0ABW2RNX9_9BACL
MDEEQKKSGRNRLLSWLGGLGVLILSLGGKLKALLPLLKFGKFGGTLITMFISIGGYALFYPLEFAVGLVIMIFIHEMGHVWAARLKGIPVSAPSFIPFLGALITMKRQPADAETEAFIAYGGPLLGTIGALLCYGLGLWLDQPVLLAIAMVGFMLNLFNMIPVHPLDGGRIVTAVTRWLWVVGLIIGAVLIFWLQSWLLIVIYLLFVMELWFTYGRKKRQPKPRTFHVEAKIPERRFYEEGMWIPGEDHRRSLPFRQYCALKDQTHLVSVEYPGLGTIATFELQGEVHEMNLVKTFPPAEEHGEVRMILEGRFTPERVGAIAQDEKYYSVSPKKRWAYGVAYFGLIAFLGYMVYLMGQTPLAQMGGS